MHRTQESTYSSELSSHAYLTLAIKPSILKTLAIKPSILWRSSPQTSWRSSPQFSNFMAIKPSILGRSTSKLSPVCFVHQHSHPYGLRDELSWVRVTNVIKCYVMLCYVMTYLMSYVLYLIHLMYFSLMLGLVLIVILLHWLAGPPRLKADIVRSNSLKPENKMDEPLLESSTANVDNCCCCLQREGGIQM